MDTDGAALHAAICDSPADDTARLVYADWLDEQGDSEGVLRAKIIRAQIEVARATDPCRREVLERHLSQWMCGPAGQRLGRHVAHIFDPTATDYGIVGVHLDGRRRYAGWEWRRGFVDQITCTAADWLAHADALHWHPGAEVACGHCAGRTPGTARAHTMNHPCRLCWGKTKLPRPCPPTAHPITAVTLTTLPLFERREEAGTVSVRIAGRERWHAIPDAAGINQRAQLLLEDEWKGITFALPDA